MSQKNQVSGEIKNQMDISGLSGENYPSTFFLSFFAQVAQNSVRLKFKTNQVFFRNEKNKK
jgi:hypothetical protein